MLRYLLSSRVDLKKHRNYIFYLLCSLSKLTLLLLLYYSSKHFLTYCKMYNRVLDSEQSKEKRWRYNIRFNMVKIIMWHVNQQLSHTRRTFGDRLNVSSLNHDGSESKISVKKFPCNRTSSIESHNNILKYCILEILNLKEKTI